MIGEVIKPKRSDNQFLTNLFQSSYCCLLYHLVIQTSTIVSAVMLVSAAINGQCHKVSTGGKVKMAGKSLSCTEMMGGELVIICDVVLSDFEVCDPTAIVIIPPVI